MEPHAPAATEDAVVAFDQRGECGPGRLVQRFDDVHRHDNENSRREMPRLGATGIRLRQYS
jgi:hypothetical protein